MNLNNLKNAVTSKGGRQLLKLRKSSPTLMFGAGVVGMVGTVVLASKATLNLEEILDDHSELALKAKEVHAAGGTATRSYDDNDLRKDMVILHTRTVAKVAKLYAPALGLGVVSIGLLTGSHVTLNRRNASLMAAYAAVDKGFREYRDRVIAELGADKDKEFAFGVEEREVYHETKKGEPKVERVKTAAGENMYAKFFDENNVNWTPVPEHNLMFLKGQQTYATQRLQAKGHLFLNEVYDALGMERTPAGAVVGWILGEGDEFVDFGYEDDDQMERFHEFLVGREGSLLLNFNVAGVIYDKI